MLRFNLKYRIALILAGFAVITFGLALMLVGTTFRMEELIASIAEKDLSAPEAADRLLAARAASHAQAVKLRIIAVAAIFITAGLSLALVLAFVNHILGPVRRLTLEAGREGTGRAPASENEIKALSQSVRGLIEDVDQTHSELGTSRENLLQAEKMALVGKLAAGMAHSIRNPFTSVKMRLFSLQPQPGADPDPEGRLRGHFRRNPPHRHHRAELPGVLPAAQAQDAAGQPVGASSTSAPSCWGTA